MILATAPFVRPPVLIAGLLALSAGVAQLVAWPAAPPEVRRSPHRVIACPRPAARPIAIFPPPPPQRWEGIHCVGNRCVISRALVDAMLSNTSTLTTTTRIAPSIHDGRVNGFKVYAIRPGSVFERLGIHNGDTVRRINGSDLDTPDQCLALYTKLRAASHVSIEIERQGQALCLEYDII